ncbi:MAG: imidazole glycerol phosphate synthase subunit HisH [Methylicorpusculum sp.]|uniref:imidazole glycerol phosphate synthase subunit HisH n=1 Tax=Methylicorpusculum sp. TaxID=2713644 RepID=UPI00271693FC|nr:imidazole glycerol phosphate synthase subunit HisH [Methylicorpusculum sp.]MDO8843307.1 imidazole glycerol phosphate synthase subunit HisH [Methylicorpusculum sp.]MDO8939461.1 imidazole glycerol phosphate synthase subunit HisH [Methylicorpusculum sp.]MDP2178662.1 imidazole glycerol phosphate synthase subunit HisH [Methylicorpusculum sp.]MDP2201155.1 imidazole glycerol phosphate synthase subunit HisH [Methylicorpusculum sp.]MDP3529547.1 imidazole glycerol phosphate synthase subunit HisH [Met
MSSVAVIDYGMGNLHSIAKALQHADSQIDINITSNHQAILDADRIVFPGVGAIGDCIHALQESGLIEIIKTVAGLKPFLGICLGMQALLTDSEESRGDSDQTNLKTQGLNLIAGHVVRFPECLKDRDGNILKVPHMGWNQVHFNSHPLWENITQASRFYFVHSYFTVPDDESVISATANYPDAFACALARENIFAVQFHPEKSQSAGLQLLRNFLHWDGRV